MLVHYIYKLAVTSFRKEVRPNCVNDNGRYRKYQFHYNHINYLKEDCKWFILHLLCNIQFLLRSILSISTCFVNFINS